MIFKQYQHEEGNCLSYLIGCTKRQVAAVIDAQYNIEPYVQFAKEKNSRITHIFETHAQADHISGAKKLADATRATLYFHSSAQSTFPFQKLNDGDVISVGNIQLKIFHTPGHTKDSVSILVTDTTRSNEPWFVLTGDTLFVGDTGRPDLDGSAEDLYESVFNKLLKLPDTVEIYPAHYAGSVCGKAMSPKPSSTIGFERKFNPALQFKSKKEFVDFALADLPVQPPRFQKVRQFNLGFLKEPPIEKTYATNELQITVEELKQKLDSKAKPFILDVREQMEFQQENLNGYLIPLGQLPKRMDELDRNKEIIVHCQTGSRSQKATEFLYENGFQNVKNLVGGINAFIKK